MQIGFPSVNPQDVRRAQIQQECVNGVKGSMDQLQEQLAEKTPAQQRAYLEKHYRNALEKFGDLLRPWTSSETDAEAVTRLLNDLRSEQQARCSHIR